VQERLSEIPGRKHSRVGGGSEIVHTFLTGLWHGASSTLLLA
jgi:hypothetical protein